MTKFDADRIDALTKRAVFGHKKKAGGNKGVAVSSHPVVSNVAVDVLRAGGNAVDAILAASVAQTVVEPHMTTICGVLSMMHYDAATGKTTYLNGSMNAPLAGLPGFSARDMTTGRSVSVPGFWAAWEDARAKFATRSSSELIAPAIDIARNGIPVFPFMYAMMFEQAHTIGLTEEGREIYYRGNTLLVPGERLVQNRLADTLENLAAKGHDYFYRSKFTEKFVATVKAAGGVLTMEDFDRYETRWMEPAWSSYHGHRIAGSPPPDNGGTHIVEILNMAELLPIKTWGPPTKSADTLYWLARLCNEVHAEGARQRDPHSWPMPLDTIVSKDYARMRLELMTMSTPLKYAENIPYPGSNHLTVVDGKGNVATVLHSVMSHPWTNGLIVDGVNIWAGAAHFMRQMPKPGDRGTCYVAPHIIFGRDDKPLLAAGSPSIGLVPNCVQNAINIIDFGMDIETSVHQPRVGGYSLQSMMTPGLAQHMVEIDCGTQALHDDVRSRGLGLDVVSPWHFHLGSYEGVHMLPGGRAEACGDPRRCGQAEAA